MEKYLEKIFPVEAHSPAVTPSASPELRLAVPPNGIVPKLAGDGDPDCVHLGATLPEDKVLAYLCQILSALAYHHARGVVHEDLKPANIMYVPPVHGSCLCLLVL